MKFIPLALFFILLPLSLEVRAQGLSPSPVKETEDTKLPEATLQDGVYFVNLKNQQVVGRKILVKFGVHGMRVKPAGEIEFGTGHHHLIINDKKVVKAGGVSTKTVVPKDETHLHFGKGEEEVEITLAPGKHTLTLQFADGMHASYGPKWSKTITVLVK